MFGLVLCAVAMLSSYLFAKRSLVAGLITALAWGYAYGILRANLASVGSYFIFDSALMGLYFGQVIQPHHPNDTLRTSGLRLWVTVLIGWPVLLLFLPFQPLEISLVGLRGNILLLPAILLGARLRDDDLQKLASAIGLLNLAVFAVALAEYNLGVDRFYPRNAITELIYNMHDVAGYTAYRIPATFSTPAGYAGTMLTTLPFLYGSLARKAPRRRSLLPSLGLFVALLGVLMSASRSTFILAVLAAIFVTFTAKIEPPKRLAWFAVLVCVGLLAASTERLQRFKLLQDTDYIEQRVAGSINRTFWDIVLEYPMGNGLGGGGTSVPYFWEGRVRRVVGLESEYARILLEQSIIGLIMWLSFLGWAFIQTSAFTETTWREGRRLAWFVCLLMFGAAMTGVGIFTAVPQSLLMFMMLGWSNANPHFVQQRDFHCWRRNSLLPGTAALSAGSPAGFIAAARKKT